MKRIEGRKEAFDQVWEWKMKIRERGNGRKEKGLAT